MRQGYFLAHYKHHHSAQTSQQHITKGKRRGAFLPRVRNVLHILALSYAKFSGRGFVARFPQRPQSFNRFNCAFPCASFTSWSHHNQGTTHTLTLSLNKETQY